MPQFTGSHLVLHGLKPGNLNIITEMLLNDKLPSQVREFSTGYCPNGSLAKVANSIQAIKILRHVYPIHTNSLFQVTFEELSFCHFPPLNTSILACYYSTILLLFLLAYDSQTTKHTQKVEACARSTARSKICLNCDNKLTTKWIRDTSSNALHAPKPDT